MIENKVEDAIKADNYGLLTGIKTKDGKISFVGERSPANPARWFGNSFKIEFKNGTTKTFPTKEAMNAYLREINPVKADNSEPVTKPTTKPILD